ncbi:MAG: S-layer homology domain-containing protein [Peptococcaceae bacterium]|nr:S-layer homology domain-containing protein [Peptococcaceae bacterium]
MKKRLISAIVSLCMLLTMVPTVAFATDSESGTPVMNGTCGAVGSESDVTWKLTQNNEDTENPTYTLSISGSGAMANLNNSTETENISDGAGTYPWAKWKDNITKIVIDDGVTSIGSKAFIGYTNVTSVSIGKDVSEIGVGALSQLAACTSFNVSSENSNFTTDTTGALFDRLQTKLIAFPCGSGVTAYEIPDTVETISYGAFSRAASLKTITIPEDSILSTIGCGAFAYTTALSMVDKIPASVTTIGDVPFAQSGIKYIYCADKNTKDCIKNKVNDQLVDVLLSDETLAVEYTDNGYTYWIDDGEALLVSAPKNEAMVTVPSKVIYQEKEYPVTGLWKGAFAISTNWTEANSSADKRNEAITSAVLPASVTQIGDHAFYFCKNLSKITIQADNVSVDNLAFATQNPNGTTVDFSAVTTLQINSTNKWAGVKKVILNNKEQLNTIKPNVNAKTIAVIGNNEWVMGADGNWTEQPKKGLTATVDNITWTFDALGTNASLIAYEPKTVENVTVPSTLTVDGVTYTVTELGAGLFGWTGQYNETDNYNTNIKNVVIPKTVTTIGADMFRYSQNLESVTIQGESVLFKKNRTFSGTKSLKALDMSAVKSITFESRDTSYFSNMGSNKSPAVIYVSSNDIMSAVETHRATTFTCYAVTNGGTFKNSPTSNTELVTPVKDGYTFAGWYENADFSGNAVTVPTVGKTYFAKWTMADSISLTSDAKGAVTYGTTVTLKASPVNSSWGYVWYKDANGNGTLELSADKQINNNKRTLALTDVSDSGTYWVLVNDGNSTKTSNAINVTIDRADVTNTAKSDVHHIFGTTYDVSKLFNIDSNAGEATYTLAENTDERAGKATLEGNVLTITKAGTIKVNLTTAQTDNYNAGAAVTATLTVDKVMPTVSITADKSTLTGSGTVKLTVSSDGVPAEGNVEVTCDNGITVTKNGDGTFTAALPNATKTYTFTASYAGDDNHESAEKSCKVSVTRRSSSGGGSSSGTIYAVSVPSTKNGDVTVSPQKASKGDNVTITVKPDGGYQLDELTVTDKNGNALKLTDKGNGQYTFTMPAGKVEVNATFAKKVETSPFSDVSTNDGYYEAVKWAQEKGITGGIGGGLFGPNQPCTRAQIVSFLWRAAGSPEPKNMSSFSDVSADSYYAKAVAWAIENGITSGTGNGKFSPDITCTRAQSVTFLYRAFGAPAVSGSTAFSDVPADTYYTAAVKWAAENGITGGIGGGLFGSDNNCTRAQIVTFLYRAYQK